MSKEQSDKLGFNAAWAMAVGGMIGGGIFATLGVVIEIAGSRAWLSFLIGGLIALATGHSYARLTSVSEQPGGLYRFLKDIGYGRAGAVASWILIAGYTLTVGVYAYAFGAYAANALGGPSWLASALAAAAIIGIAGINIAGTGDASTAEIAAVWFKVAVLVALSAVGIAAWNPASLTVNGAAGWSGALVGVGTVFMGYEGFQFLTYDQDDLRGGAALVARTIPVAVLTALVIYIGISLGTVMLVGAKAMIAHKEVALAEAGRAAAGTAGFVLVTIAAILSTASAINATLFATARLTREVASGGDLPHFLGRSAPNGTPRTAILIVAIAALVLALAGNLTSLVQASGLVFLLVFAAVNALAFRNRRSWISAVGLAGAAGAAIMLALYLAGVV